ncbi:MAG: hypothetical protein ACI89E_000875, partial [Planctomycetota bacterium]
ACAQHRNRKRQNKQDGCQPSQPMRSSVGGTSLMELDQLGHYKW